MLPVHTDRQIEMYARVFYEYRWLQHRYFFLPSPAYAENNSEL